MRQILVSRGWQLIAGEFPGGSDHELYPINVVDPAVAKDRSPDPRRHSLGELIPDLVALKGRNLLIGEAKPAYNRGDQEKLRLLLSDRGDHLRTALEKFANERDLPQLLPISTLDLWPTLVFLAGASAPLPTGRFSYLRIVGPAEGFFQGALEEIG